MSAASDTRSVVHLDAVGHQILYAFPVAPFKQGFGLGGFFTEQAVVLVESGQHGFGNFAGRRGCLPFFPFEFLLYSYSGFSFKQSKAEACGNDVLKRGNASIKPLRTVCGRRLRINAV